MQHIVNFLNDNSGAIQGISTLVLVCVTAYYAVQTKKTVDAMERSEERQKRPQIALFLTPRDDLLSIIDLNIANYGNGVARNITFEVLGTNFLTDPSRKESTIKSFRVFKNGIKTLGPGQKYQAWLTSVIGRVDELQRSRTQVRIRYEGVDGSKYDGSYRLDFKSLPERQLGSPILNGIQKSIEKVAQNLKDIERKIK